MKKLNTLFLMILFGFHQMTLAAEVIKIVSDFPITGSTNAVSLNMNNAILMAIEDHMKKTGTFGFDFKFEAMDHSSPLTGKWDPTLVIQNAESAINDPEVMVVIGPYTSGASKMSMPKLNQARLAMISPSATYPGLTKKEFGEANEPMAYRLSKNVNFFRVVPSDEIQAEYAVNWIIEMALEIKKSKNDSSKIKLAIANDSELYGKSLSLRVKALALEKGIDIVVFEQLIPNALHYKGIVTKFRQHKPDVLFFGGNSQTGSQFIKDLRTGGLPHLPIFLPDGGMEAYMIEATGAKHLVGKNFFTFCGAPPDHLGEKGQEFYKLFEKRFGIPPEPITIYAYESILVALEAIERVAPEIAKANNPTAKRAIISDSLLSIRNFNGVLGHPWSFDENGDTTLNVISGYGVGLDTEGKGVFEFIKILN